MLDYDTTMQIGQRRYQDVLDMLAAAGLGATFTQTGGMNAALEVLLDGGHTLLITDAEDSLPWERSEQAGWGVGLYPPDHANEGWDTSWPPGGVPRRTWTLRCSPADLGVVVL